MRKFFKILLYILGGIILLLVLIALFLQTQWGKDFLRKQAVSYLQGKLHTEVRIDKLDYTIPDKVSLDGVFIRDLNKDTLLDAHHLLINLDMWGLIRSKVSVDNILLDGVNANIYRKKTDTLFNYDFIVKAFAGSDTAKVEPADTSSQPLDINIGRVTLKNIRFVYNDEAGGTYFSMNLGNLVTRFRKLDLDKMQFDLHEFSVSRLKSYVATDSSYLPPAPDTGAAAPFILSVDKIHLDSIQFSFLGKPDSTFFGLNLGVLNTTIRKFDLLQQTADLGSLQLEDIRSALTFGKPSVKSKVKEEASDTAASSYNWRVMLDKGILNKIAFKYDDNSAPHIASGMDYSHLDFKGFSMNINNLLYSSDTIKGNLSHAALMEQCGLNVVELRTNFLYCNKGALLKDLYILTPGTELQNLLDVKYPSLAAVQKDMNKLHLNIDINKSKVSMKDVMLFMEPEQKKMLAAYSKDQFNIAARMNGYLNALQIQNFAAKGLSGTDIQVNGKLNGLPDADKMSYDFNILKLRSNYKDIEPFLTDSIKMLVSVPDWFMVNGHISGTKLDYRPDLTINTADGDAMVKGALLLSPGEGKEKYNLIFSTKELNIGKIIKQDSVLGLVTMSGSADGSGFDPKLMNTTFNADIASLWALNYGYNHLHLNGVVSGKQATIKGNSIDPNLNFTLNALADLSGQYPSLKGDLNIVNLDPQALNLYNDSLKFSGDIHADFETLNPDYLSGFLTINNPVLRMAGYKLAPDSVYFSSKPSNDSIQDIVLDLADVVHANLSGHIPLTKAGDAIIDHIDKHYKITDLTFSPPQNYDLNLNAHIVYRPILRTWLPQLKKFDTIKLDAVVRPDTFSIFGYVPRLINGTDRLDSGIVKVYENGDTLRYGLSMKRIASGQYQLWYPTIMGGIRKDSIYTRIVLNDSTGKNQFAFGAAVNHDMKSDSGLTYVRMFKGVLLNYERWDVNPANRLVLGPRGFYVRDFSMSKGNESITAESEQADFRAPFQLNIHDFSLANITRMFSKDTLLADGRLNAALDMEFNDTFPAMYLRGGINDLVAYNQPVGNLDLTASNSGPDIYSFLMKLTGNQNDLTLDGSYYLQPLDSNDFKMKLNANALYLKSLEGLSFGSIKNSSGFIKGQLDITGTTQHPKLLGELHTEKLVTTPSILNTPYSLPDEKIVFGERGITLDNFSIYDIYNNKLVINGQARTRSWTRFFLDMDVSAKNWLAVNSTKKDYDLFYGKLILSTDLSLKGLATAPTIEGQLQIEDSTKITYAMIDQGPGVVASEGIVRFVDSRDSTFVDSTQIVTKRRFSVNRSSEVNINVGIDKNAEFNVIIDPLTGDKLQVKGEANLNTEIGADGAVGLTGTYQLQDGYYQLNYNFVKRKFKIQSGSTIALSGDPTDAEVDITAVYESKIAPYELVQQQVSPDELNYYKQRLPFQILLKLKGKVMQPAISFDIVLPDAQTNTASSSVTDQVQRKLTEIRNDPSQLNKQVFAALILGRFIADDPFASSSDAGLEYAARQSASRFLSDQLNNLAGQLIKGVDLNVVLESSEDYSTGTRNNVTDLSVSASKKLFSDRLNVTIGNDFQLEGQTAQSQQSSLIPGNLSADYQLTKDGKYLVRGYRVNQLQNIIDGYVVETGISFRINLEYNKFKYIFRNRAKQRRKRQEAREREAAKKEESEAHATAAPSDDED